MYNGGFNNKKRYTCSLLKVTWSKICQRKERGCTWVVCLITGYLIKEVSAEEVTVVSDSRPPGEFGYDWNDKLDKLLSM